MDTKSTRRRTIARAMVWSALVASCGFFGSAPTDPRLDARVLRSSTASAPGSSPATEHHERSMLAASLVAREYRPSPAADGLQAPNRVHDLRIFFEPSGIRVHDRTPQPNDELLRLSLVATGRGEQRVALSDGEEVVVDGDRVEIRRPGLVEWYLNSAAGLEQGFTLAAPPGLARRNELSDSGPTGEPLVLELAVDRARARLHGSEIRLTTGSGRTLSYGALAVVDATGEQLAARFEVPRSDRIQLIVDDSEATYPIVIDPLLTELADASVESNQIEAQLGLSVAGAGDVNGDGYDDVIVGAPFYDAGQTDEGAAFVFHGGPSGITTAGAASAATQLESDQSSLNPFTDSPPRFGISVSGAGDVNGDGYDDVIVGAPFYDAGQVDEGAAFVFLGGPAGIPDGSPATAATQLESNLAASAFPFIPATSFARNVSGAGDLNGDGYADVLVGATGYDAGQTDEGAVFVYLGGPAGIADGDPATAAARLESNQASAGFGSSLSSAGDVNSDGHADVIVGADSYLGRGAAFVFPGSGSGLSNANPSTPGVTELVSTQTGSAFGTSVSAAGDVDGDGFGDVIVGAPSYDTSGSDEGSAFIFRGGATGIADGSELIASRIQSDQTGARLGQSVSGLGDVNGDGYGDVAVGAHQYDSLSVNDGAVFVFLGRPAVLPSGFPSTAYAHLDVGQSEAWMGWSVAGAGDVNGDGYADVLAGATLFDAGQTNEGRAYLHRGGALGLSGAANASPQILAGGSLQGSEILMQAEPAGDVNGDGFGDLLVSGGPIETASAVLHFGTSTGVVTDPADPLLPPQPLPGANVASAGDVNGDGYGDVIVGVPTYDGGETDEGAALVFLGSAAGIPEDAGGQPIVHARIESDQAGAKLGSHVASAGDVNGDGYGDVVVVAVGYDAGQLDEGAAFVFLGSATGIANGSPATAHARLEVDQPGIAFFPGDPSTNSMLTVAGSAGDVNGDGFGDVVIVAPHYAAPEYNEGTAFVFLGSAGGLANGNPANAHARFETNQQEGDPSSFPNQGVLEDARAAGDLNRDGFDDLVLGAPRYSNGQFWEGAAFVLFGSATGLENATPATADARFESDQANASVGSHVDAAGDVDGDGFGDLVVSGNRFAFVPEQPIWAFVLRGSATGIVPQGPFGFLHGVVGTAEDTTGLDVAGAGDVNGDGFGDVIVQAISFEPLGPIVQQVSSYLAHSAGHSILPTQRRGDGSGIRVQRGGSAFSPDRFEVELFARSPRGRELSKLEVEVCPTGVAFGDALGCTKHESPSWIDLGSSGAIVAASVTGLESGAAHSWRARLRFTPYRTSPPSATAPVVVGPWLRLGARTSIGDVRTVPEPGIGSGLLVGALLLGARRGRAGGAMGRGAAQDRDRVASSA